MRLNFSSPLSAGDACGGVRRWVSKLDSLNLQAKLIKDMEATIRWNSEAQARPQERLGAKEKKARQALAKQEPAEVGGLGQPIVAKAQSQRKATEEIIL